MDVCVSVWAIAFDPVLAVDIETSFWTSSPMSLQVKFEYQGHRVKAKITKRKWILSFLNINLSCFDLFKLLKICRSFTVYQQAGCGPSTERHS